MSGDDPYLIPGTRVLQNKLGITDAGQLDRAERLLTAQRAREGVPTGKFDLDHAKAIHGHLFQDVYAWAGQLRTVEISKGGHQFQLRHSLETGFADIHRRLQSSAFLRSLDTDKFAAKAGEIIGDVNYVHPFREGNGRTQLEYLRQLATQAGHPLDPGRFDRDQWISASKAAHTANYGPMAGVIRNHVVAQSFLDKTPRERLADPVLRNAELTARASRAIAHERFSHDPVKLDAAYAKVDQLIGTELRKGHIFRDPTIAPNRISPDPALFPKPKM